MSEMPYGVGVHPMSFLSTDNKAKVDAFLLEPFGRERQALQKGSGVTHQCAGKWHVSYQSSDVTGWSGKYGFRKDQRARSGRIFQRLFKKTARILNAAGLGAENEPKPPFGVAIGRQAADCFQSCGSRVLRNRTGPAKAGMSQESGAGRRRRDGTHT